MIYSSFLRLESLLTSNNTVLRVDNLMLSLSTALLSKFMQQLQVSLNTAKTLPHSSKSVEHMQRANKSGELPECHNVTVGF